MDNHEILLIQAGLHRDAKILDVGAGGFCGAVTTKNLLSNFIHENISLIEVKEESYNKLCAAFPRCKKIHGDFFTHDFGAEKFDLISIDLDSIIQFTRWDEILTRANSLLKDGGNILTYSVRDMSFIKMLTGPSPSENETIIRKHIFNIYLSDGIVTGDHFKKYFGSHEHFEFIHSRPKNDLIQWVLLKKKGSSTQLLKESKIKRKNSAAPVLTVALPAYNSGNIAWLAMESLCAQENVNFKWELIIIEEQSPNPFTSAAFLAYSKRLTKVGCVSIRYIPLERKITLSEKWKRIGECCAETSEAFVLQTCDCYSYPGRLKMTHDAISQGYDWCQVKQGYFYEIQTGRTIRYNGDLIDWSKNHLNMAFRTEYARSIPFAELPCGIDGWLFTTFEKQKGSPLSIFNCFGNGWERGVDTHGANNISVARARFFNEAKPPFQSTEMPIEGIVPIKIAERLRCMK